MAESMTRSEIQATLLDCFVKRLGCKVSFRDGREPVKLLPGSVNMFGVNDGFRGMVEGDGTEKTISLLVVEGVEPID